MTNEYHLTQQEFEQLLTEATEAESHALRALAERLNMDPFAVVTRFAHAQNSLVIDGKPIYFAAVFMGKKPTLWTIVTKNNPSQITLFRFAKRGLQRWIKQFKILVATMPATWSNNLRWTERLGFQRQSEENGYVTLVLGG